MKKKTLKLDFKLNKTIYNYINNEGIFFHKLQSAMFGFKLLSVLSVQVSMYARSMLNIHVYMVSILHGSHNYCQ